jgi:hypothetical protein
MPSLPQPQPASNPRPRFRTPPWHDDHPARRELEQRMSPDHLARTIADAVARLDLSELYATYGNTGSDAHRPDLLLGAVLFEMQRGHPHPSEWHLHACESEPVRWLLRGSVVARSCWYSFRDRVALLLDDLNAQVLHEAVAAEVTPATRAAGDGTAVAANASRHKLLHQEQCQKRLAVVAAAVAADHEATASAGVSAPPTARFALPVLDAVPIPPVDAMPPNAGAAPAKPPAWLAETVRGRFEQQQRLERAQERLKELHAYNQRKWASKRKAADRIVVSVGDPEAVVGRDKEKVFRPLYNVQLFADLDSPLILGYGVFAQQNDNGILETMLARVKQQVGHGLQLVLADTSYAGGADLAAAAQAGVTVYAPVPGDSVENPKQIPKRDFVWLASEQVYICPQGHRLALEESWYEKRAEGRVRVWRYRCAAVHCQGCPLQPRCTRTPSSGRAVQRLEHEELLEALRARMARAEAKALYRQRGQHVELANADCKQHRKLRRFSGRGLVRVIAEVGLLVLAHNLVALSKITKAPAEQDKNATVSPNQDST